MNLTWRHTVIKGEIRAGDYAAFDGDIPVGRVVQIGSGPVWRRVVLEHERYRACRTDR